MVNWQWTIGNGQFGKGECLMLNGQLAMVNLAKDNASC